MIIPEFHASVVLVTATLVASTVATAALVLTTDREPRPLVRQTSTRPDGCVMLCDPAPPSPLLEDGTCVIGCPLLRSPQHPPNSDRCVMFCDTARREGDR